MKDNLVISEKFTSVQGEGQTMGRKSIFLRLAGCNILCQSNSWVCDTIEVWQKGVSTPFENVFTDEEVSRMKKGSHLIITGGEPLLHQKKITEFIQWFGSKYLFIPVIEFETNGTIIPNIYLLTVAKYWNVSFKLANSGVKYNDRIKQNALDCFNKKENSIFKIVIEKETDIVELKILIGLFALNPNKIWLMPAGSSQEELLKTRDFVVQKSIELNFNFSDRLHISIWNKKTGV